MENAVTVLLRKKKKEGGEKKKREKQNKKHSRSSWLVIRDSQICSLKTHLHHLCMDVEAGVAQLGDFLGQQFHSLGRVAEDDGLIDLQLWRSQKKEEEKIHGGTSGYGVRTAAHVFSYRVCACVFTLEKSVLRQCTFCRSVT